MKALLAVIALGVGAFSVSSCTPPKKEETQVTRTVILGDPMNLIAGAKTQPNVNVKAFDTEKVYLYGINIFSEKTTVTEMSKVGEPASQAAPTKIYTAEERYRIPFKTEISPNGKAVLLDGGKGAMTFRPRRDGENGYELIFKLGGMTKVEAKVIHFSESEDKKFISILVLNEAQGKDLVQYTFSKSKEGNPIPTTQAKYFFEAGPGAKVGHLKNKPIEFKICGEMARKYTNEIQNAALQWNEAANGKFLIKVDVADEYYPYSDLNQKCIYFTDNYRVEASESGAVYAGTMNYFDLLTPRILDSDIIFFKREFEKRDPTLSTNKFKYYMAYSALHELGHALGLAHQFTGVKSIMSYNFGPPILSDYDREAINALYE